MLVLKRKIKMVDYFMQSTQIFGVDIYYERFKLCFLFKQKLLPLKGSNLSTGVYKSLGVAYQIFFGICYTRSNMSHPTSNFGFGQFNILL